MSSSATFLALALAAARPLGCGTVSVARDGLRSLGLQDGQACTELVNQGIFFTVDVEVGTPGQKFSVVADTGSNTLIVPSCLCNDGGTCSSMDRCFKGHGRSSTFAVINGSSGKPQSLLLTFGSGEIEGVLAKDVVRVGALEKYMRDGIMLMTRKGLKFSSSFEGILGLGIPRAAERFSKQRAPAAQPSTPSSVPGDLGKAFKERLKKIAQKINGISFAAVRGTTALRGALPSPNLTMPRDVNSESGGLDGLEANSKFLQPGGFLEQAGIARFSMCFNDGTNGVLRIGMPEIQNAHGSVGRLHWGVDFRGLSIGKHEVPLSICSPDSKTRGQETACAVIPDSGTTLIMAPQEHLNKLYDGLCDAWDRCSQKHTALMKAKKAFSKSVIFRFLLKHCDTWLGEGSTLAELPPIHFQVAGSRGTKQTLTLSAGDYIFEASWKGPAGASLSEDVEEQSPEGLEEAALADADGAVNASRVCKPAFGPHEYNTEQNGPVWVLGSPLFYQFSVGYDLSTKPASISFTSTSEAPCGTCDKKAGLVVAGATSARGRSLRRIEGRPRMPSIDVSSPL